MQGESQLHCVRDCCSVLGSRRIVLGAADNKVMTSNVAVQ
jgi:hypothetical protein